jgi:carbonic anhydrase
MHRSVRGVLFLLLFALPAAAQTNNALWESLMEGNRVYIAGKLTFDHLAVERRESADHQNPPVTVLSCSDSRVPPELVFNRSINQLFVIRVAGNVAGPFDLASIEYAISKGYTKLIVVLGHEECGAVTSALAPADPPTPSLVALVQRIRESFIGIDKWSLERATVRRAVEANARGSAAYLIAHSQVIRDAVQSERVGMVVAYYNLESGVVEKISR